MIPARIRGRRLSVAVVSLVLAAAAWAAPADQPAQNAARQLNDDIEKAVAAGDFTAGFERITEWLNVQTPGRADRAALVALIDRPDFRRLLDTRQLIAACGAKELGAFTKADPANRALLTWLFSDTETMDLLLEGAVPLKVEAREKNQSHLKAPALEILRKILAGDGDAKAGLCRKLAIATALAPPGTGAPGAGHARPPVDPVERYRHFKQAQRNGELFPSFDKLTVWEYQKVVQSGASNEDLAWGRQMIRTFRPDLLQDEMVVNSTSFVWRRNAPPEHYPYKDMRTVLAGGGKCGPRSSWAVFICQAWGVPAIGVGQPAHACVAFRSANPMAQPQPGSRWKVAYGRGWKVSKLEGMSGPEFLQAVGERSHAAEFSRIEHLRWLAAAVSPTEKSAAILQVLNGIRGSLSGPKTDLAASHKPEEAEADPGAKPPASPPRLVTEKVDPTAPRSSEPIRPSGGAFRVPAAAFAKTGGQISWGGQSPHVLVHHGPEAQPQVHFQAQMKSQWADYILDVPAAGSYRLIMQAACVNDHQVLEVCSGEKPLAKVAIPLTYGLWQETPPVELHLDKGVQTLRVQTPTTELKRGVALRAFELKRKD